MKRVLLMVLSIVLVIACVFSIARVVPAVNDLLNIYDYKMEDSNTATEGIAAARDGIALLTENEQTYLDGVKTYVAGQAEFAAGQAAYAAGQKELAAGQAQIDANTQAYLEGKELISKMESLMPTVEALANSIQDVRDFNAGIIGGTMDQYLGAMRANVLNFLANGQAVKALSDIVGMDIASILASNPTDTSILGNVVNMYYDGLAQLKMYEDGLKQLEDGKKQLADGAAQLAAGAAQLADGNKQLTTFEEGEATLADGMMQLLMGMGPSYHQKSFVQTVDSLPEYLAKTDEMKADIPALYNEDGFDEAAYAEFCAATVERLYMTNEDGDYVCTKRDGKVIPLLDLNKCTLLLDKAEQYMADSEVDVTAEVVARVVCYVLIVLAAILGLIAGIMGLVAGITGGKKTGKTLGIIAAVMSVGALVYAIISKFGDYIYGIRVDEAGAYSVAMEGTHIEYSGDYQHPVFLVMVIATVLFVVFAVIAKKAAKEKASKKAVAAAASSAAVAGAADSERMTKLEAENAELKAMVAEMAADAATTKD